MTMTVAELIEKLKAMPQDAPVIICGDVGGYVHHPLHGVDDDLFWVETDPATGYGEVDDYAWSRGGAKCVVLWP